MGKNKNKKKAKEEKAAEADSPTGETAKSKLETLETSQPVSYAVAAAAAAAAEPPTEGNKITDISMNAPSITVTNLASDSGSPFAEPVPTSPSPRIFEDDVVDMAFLSTPDLKQNKEVDSSDLEFSHLKKDEISDAGSPGQLVNKEPSNEDTSKEKPATDGKALEGKCGESGNSLSKAKTTEWTGTESKASSHSSMRRALPFQKTSSALVRSVSKADWDKMFDSGPKVWKDVDAGEASTQDGATGTTAIHPAVTVSLHVEI